VLSRRPSPQPSGARTAEGLTGHPLHDNGELTVAPAPPTVQPARQGRRPGWSWSPDRRAAATPGPERPGRMQQLDTSSSFGLLADRKHAWCLPGRGLGPSSAAAPDTRTCNTVPPRCVIRRYIAQWNGDKPTPPSLRHPGRGRVGAPSRSARRLPARPQVPRRRAPDRLCGMHASPVPCPMHLQRPAARALRRSCRRAANLTDAGRQSWKVEFA